MQVNDNVGFKGQYFIETIDTKTGERERIEVKNTLTNINKNIHLAMLFGDTSGYSFDDLNIKYLAFGTGTTAAKATDTKLESEYYRKQVTTKTLNTTDGYLETIVSLGSLECNITIREIGVFAGASATATANSGNMISRLNVNIEKFENKIINIIRRDIVTI